MKLQKYTAGQGNTELGTKMRLSRELERSERLWKGKNSEKQPHKADYEILGPLLICESDLILFHMSKISGAEIMICYYTGPRLTTGWHTYEVDPNSTTKGNSRNLKTD